MNQVAIINTFRVSWISFIFYFFTKTEKILMNDTDMRVYFLLQVVNNESRSDKCECERDRQTNIQTKTSAKTFCKIYEVNIELRMVSKTIN